MQEELKALLNMIAFVPTKRGSKKMYLRPIELEKGDYIQFSIFDTTKNPSKDSFIKSNFITLKIDIEKARELGATAYTDTGLAIFAYKAPMELDTFMKKQKELVKKAGLVTVSKVSEWRELPQRVNIIGELIDDDLPYLIKSSDLEPEKHDWLIEGLWVNKSVGLIVAPPKAHKSILTLNIAKAVATGTPLDGRKSKQAPVVILQGENSLGNEKGRLQQMGVGDDAPIYFVKDSSMTLDNIDLLKPSLKKIKAGLLIIDPLYMLLGSGDINSQADMTRKLKKLTNLKKELDISIILVHHTKKIEDGDSVDPSKIYGTNFFNGWYESLIMISGQRKQRLHCFFRAFPSAEYSFKIQDDLSAKIGEPPAKKTILRVSAINSKGADVKRVAIEADKPIYALSDGDCVIFSDDKKVYKADYVSEFVKEIESKKIKLKILADPEKVLDNGTVKVYNYSIKQTIDTKHWLDCFKSFYKEAIKR